ncbi:MAG: phosphoribosyltransferase [Oscillospiraceae bacterium]|nr:phosphoribosyltransferase [Oscillospiraceae bacterium]
MEERIYSITHHNKNSISVSIIPGHFAIKSTYGEHSSHCSHYMDLSTLKSNAASAKDIAKELVVPYQYGAPVDTIVCMENTKVIGAYIAQELLASDMGESDIHITTPMRNSLNQLTFYDSELPWIRGKNILILTAMISSGRSVQLGVECLEYYGGIVSGISALFSATNKAQNYNVNALFTSDYIEDYRHYPANDCELCRRGVPMDAIVSSEGYKRIS